MLQTALLACNAINESDFSITPYHAPFIQFNPLLNLMIQT